MIHNPAKLGVGYSIQIQKPPDLLGVCIRNGLSIAFQPMGLFPACQIDIQSGKLLFDCLNLFL